jgi:hypothetical protein
MNPMQPNSSATGSATARYSKGSRPNFTKKFKFLVKFGKVWDNSSQMGRAILAHRSAYPLPAEGLQADSSHFLHHFCTISASFSTVLKNGGLITNDL